MQLSRIFNFFIVTVASFFLSGCTQNVEEETSAPETVQNTQDIETTTKSEDKETVITPDPVLETGPPQQNSMRESAGVERPLFTITKDSKACSKIPFSSDMDISQMEIAMRLGAYTLYAEPRTLVCDTPFLLSGSCAVADTKPFRVVTQTEDLIFQKTKSGSISFLFDENEMGCVIIERQ